MLKPGNKSLANIQRTDVLGLSMASFIAQQINFTHSERVNKLVLYVASCGGLEGIPQTPEVVRTFVNNPSQDADGFCLLRFR